MGRKGDGSVGYLGEGRWKLRVALGKGTDGRYRQHSENFWAKGDRRTSERAARARLRELADEVRGRPEGNGVTLNVAIDTWLEELAEAERSPQTIYEYRRQAERYIRPSLGDELVADLTHQQIARFYVALKKAGAGARTVQTVHKVVRQTLVEAKRQGWVTEIVADDARLPTSRPKKRAIPTDATIRALIDAAMAADRRLGVLVLLAATAGLRRGELCGLRRCDVQGDVLDVSGSYSVVPRAFHARKTTKTGTERRVPLDAPTAAVVADYMDSQAKAAADRGLDLPDHAWLFPKDADGDRPAWLPSSLSQRVNKLVAKAGLPNTTPQDLRRYHASALKDSGVEDVVIAARLGHASTHTTRGHYIKPFSEAEVAAAAVVAQRLG